MDVMKSFDVSFSIAKFSNKSINRGGSVNRHFVISLQCSMKYTRLELNWFN